MTEQITEQDKWSFTHGGCLILADEISKATGWPVCTFDCDDWPIGVHCFNRLPDGRYLDVKGIATEDEMIGQYEKFEPYAISDGHELDEYIWNALPDDPSNYGWVRRAREIAPSLIEMAQEMVMA